MRPAAGEVLHFSEDPTIEIFRPHVAKTALQGTAYVWAVGHDRAPDYWFPRQPTPAPRTLDQDLRGLQRQGRVSAAKPPPW